ncbi:glycosyltransferase family 2 protein [Paenibacillus rhizophilus]|uniref:Glycosyltransferase family 2 protein n=1 Tax=Paenibacillus rhizophilus TaxID=1850366 RepID=A0A3N9P0D1_9BACL|nr:glycosyltransferase family 2 protein [Paenibacillus rhizophilus]RQW09661.1 glycosyltransferase family 2 protein [Paenibacillus rhizophilus]
MSLARIDRLVSIVIPCFNAESYIEDCLDHLYGQTYPNIEIIIVDDASTDRSADRTLLWQARRRFPRFTLLQLPRNVGFSGSLTTGLFMASGEYIAIHDADDYSHPERIRKQVEFLMNHPQIDLVGTNYMAFEDSDMLKLTPSSWLSYGEDIPRRYAIGEHCVSHPTILFRGSVFDRLGGLSRNMNGAEDYEFIAKCVTNGIRIENLRETLYYYRSHPAQRSHEFYSE